MSGFKGVCWHKQKKKSRAQIDVNGKRTHLGYFSDPVQAAIAYDSAALELYGEFARLSFPAPTAEQVAEYLTGLRVVLNLSIGKKPAVSVGEKQEELVA